MSQVKVVSQDIKTCRECLVPLSLDNWQTSQQKARNCICRSCNNSKTTLWKSQNRDKVNLQKKAWYLKTKDKNKAYAKTVPSKRNRKYSLKGLYGLSWDEYLELYNKFNGECGICSKALSLTKEEDQETAHVDHCHDTGKVRGILCRSCNRGIGYLNDSPDRLLKASNYLTTNQESRR